MGLRLPSREVLERHIASGLTKYSLVEIDEVAAAVEAVERETDEVMQQASAVIERHDQHYPFWELHAPAHVQAVLCIGTEERLPDFQAGSMANDLFPVKKFWREVARAKALNARRRKVIDAANALDAVPA